MNAFTFRPFKKAINTSPQISLLKLQRMSWSLFLIILYLYAFFVNISPGWGGNEAERSQPKFLRAHSLHNGNLHCNFKVTRMKFQRHFLFAYFYCRNSKWKYVRMDANVKLYICALNFHEEFPWDYSNSCFFSTNFWNWHI